MTGLWRRVRRFLVGEPPADHAARIDEELRAHIDERIDYLTRRGVSDADARADAYARFGDFDAGRRALLDHAHGRPTRLTVADHLADWLDDARYIVRALRRQPAFTLGVAFIMALGLGVNAAVFRVADYVLFRPPAGVAHARDIRWVEETITFRAGGVQSATTYSYPDAARLLGTAGAASATYANVTLRDASGRDVGVTYCGADFFTLLGVQPRIGRLFDAAESRTGSGGAVALVSDAYWKSALSRVDLAHAAPLTLGQRQFTIVGVMPPGFAGIQPDPIDVWLPFGVAEIGRTEINGVVIPWYESRMMRAMRVIARVPRGAEASAASQFSAGMTTPDDRDNGMTRTAVLRPIVPLGGGARGQDVTALLGRLTAVAAVVLLIACANTVNLLLARGLRRRQEIAIRLAIGASRGRIARLVLGESLLLGVFGGVFALAATFWTSEALRRLVLPDAKWSASTFDARTWWFTAAAALVAGTAAGALPAWQLARAALVDSMKQAAGRGSRRVRGVRRAVVVLQVALSLALLVASALLVHSMVRLNDVPLGFDPDGLIGVSSGALMFGPPSQDLVSAADVAARIPASVAPASSIALTSLVPFGTSSRSSMRVLGSDYVPAPPDEPQIVAVAPNFFRVMRTPIVDGRDFSDADNDAAEPVAIVSALMAKQYFNGPIPAGACVLVGGHPCARIVGVAADISDTPGGGAPPMRYFLPLAQWGGNAAGLVMRTQASGAHAQTPALRALFPSTQRGVTVEVIADRVARALHPWRTATFLFVALGALALIIAGAGLYSVMSYMASERAHELGVRVVLGAKASDIRALVLGEGLRLMAAGLLLGAIAAAIIGRSLGALLFGVSAVDPLAYAAGIGLLVAAALAAVWPPARRAARVNPVSVMRIDS